MKKSILIIGIIIFLALMLLCLTGCGSNNNSVVTDNNENVEKDNSQETEQKTFKVGNYTVKYGWYTDGNVSKIKIMEDGTLNYGGKDYNYTIESDCINVENKMYLKVTDNNCFDQIVNGNVMTSYTYSKYN